MWTLSQTEPVATLPEIIERKLSIKYKSTVINFSVTEEGHRGWAFQHNGACDCCYFTSLAMEGGAYCTLSRIVLHFYYMQTSKMLFNVDDQFVSLFNCTLSSMENLQRTMVLISFRKPWPLSPFINPKGSCAWSQCFSKGARRRV